MTNKDIYRALGGLDPELIANAAPAEMAQKKKNRPRRISAVAACLALVVCLGIALHFGNFGAHIGTNSDNSDMNVGTNSVNGDIPTYNKTFGFSSREELLEAFLNSDAQSTDTVNGYVKVAGERYGRFVRKVRQDQTVPLPMLNGQTMQYLNEEGFSNITFFSSELYDMPWIWHHCTVDGEKVAVKMTYPECADVEIDDTKTCAENLRTLEPHAVNIHNYTQYEAYENVYEKTLTLADGEVSALIYEIKYSNEIYVAFFKNEAMFILHGNSDILDDEFFAAFSIK